MALHTKYNSDYAACLKNAVNFLVVQKYKINVCLHLAMQVFRSLIW
jgi:hypothetical protein